MSVEILQAPAGRRRRRCGYLSGAHASIKRLSLTVAVWIVRSAERRALRELAKDRRLLSHAGLTREQLLGKAAKPFWRR